MGIKEYADISADVWQVFKKYVPSDADLTTFTDDVHKLDQKYHKAGNLKAYKFMQRLLKAYFDELGEIKGEQHEVIDKS